MVILKNLSISELTTIKDKVIVELESRGCVEGDSSPTIDDLNAVCREADLRFRIVKGSNDFFSINIYSSSGIIVEPSIVDCGLSSCIKQAIPIAKLKCEQIKLGVH